MYKKIYLEITNNCNLDCSFCIKNNRDKKFMSLEDYELILNKIKNHTKYLYFHVSGEPLLHPEINKFINIGVEKGYFINITTNGYLIKRVIDNKNIRQINISLHSYNEKYNISLHKYITDICEVINNLCSNTYFSLRFWVNSKHNQEIIKILEEKLKTKIKLENGYKVQDNVYISINKEFIWPDLKNEYISNRGTCYALKDHIGILVNGNIIPCCLDANCVIKLGNIYNDNLENIIQSDRYQNMLNGFKKHYKCEELCQKCNFIE